MKKLIKLMTVVIFVCFSFFACAGTTMKLDSKTDKMISVSAEVAGFKYNPKGCWPKKSLGKVTFIFHPSKIKYIPEKPDGSYTPVSISSPLFGRENEKVWLRIEAIKDGKNQLYYAFIAKYYNLKISYIITHENLKKLEGKKFRIQLDSSDKNTELETPMGPQTIVYFEGWLE